MKKTILALSAAALAVLASTPALAGGGWWPNGVSHNGVTLNGLTLNGLTLNGLNLNGLTLNGVQPNGAAGRGAPAGYTIRSITLAGGSRLSTAPSARRGDAWVPNGVSKTGVATRGGGWFPNGTSLSGIASR